jgi:hypothetical protein
MIKNSLKLIKGINNPFSHSEAVSLISSTQHNVALDNIKRLVMNTLPSTEIGFAVLLQQDKGSEFVKRLSAKEIDVARRLHASTTAWIKAVEDTVPKNFVFTTSPLGLSAGVLMLLRLDKLEVRQSFVPMIVACADLVAAEMMRKLKDPKALSHEGIDDGRVGGVRIGIVSSIIDDAIERTITAQSFANVYNVSIKNDSEAGASLKELMEDGGLMTTFSTEGLKAILSIWFSLTLSKFFGYGSGQRKSLEDVISTFIPQTVDSKAIDAFVTTGAEKKSGVNTTLTSTRMESLEREVLKSLGSNTVSALQDISRTVDGLINFREDLAKYFASQGSFYADSFRSGDKLLRDYRSMLDTVRSVTDVTSARDAVDSFVQSSEFRKSVAGMLYSMSTHRDAVDDVVINDVIHHAVDYSILRTFNEGPVGQYAEVKKSVQLVPDYGMSVSGLSYTVKYLVTSDIRFSEGRIAGVNGINLDDHTMSWMGALNDKDAKRYYAVLAATVLGNADARHMVGRGASRMTSLSTQYKTSTSVFQELGPIMAAIDDCIAVQFHIHKVAASSWFMNLLSGLRDMCVFFIRIADVKKGHLSRHPFFEKAVENARELNKEVETLLSGTFNVDVPDVPANAVPKVTFSDGKEAMQDMEQVMRYLVMIFAEKKTFFNMKEQVRYAKSANSRSGLDGQEFAQARSVFDLKDSLILGAEAALRSKLPVPVKFDISRERAQDVPSGSSDMLLKHAFRNQTGLHWSHSFSVEMLLNAVINGDSKFVNDQILSRIGSLAEQIGRAPDHVVDRLRLLAGDNLKVNYIFDHFEKLRYARMHRTMTPSTISVLRLAASPKEGRAFGYAPEAIPFTSNDDAKTLQSILAAVGVSTSTKLTKHDWALLSVVANGRAAGFPLALSEIGDSLAMTSFTNTEELSKYRVGDVVSLAPHFKLNGAEVGTFMVYIRDFKLINLMINDHVSEDFLSDYDILQITDEELRRLRGDDGVGEFFMLDTSVDRDPNDIVTSAVADQVLIEMARTLADTLFPGVIVAKAKPSEKDDDDADDDETDPNPGE